MTEIDGRFADQLEALSAMLQLSVKEIEEASIPTDLGGVALPLLLIFTTSMSALDSVRILLEHGYSEQAHALTRSLYDAEIDVALLAADTDLLGLYVDFELLDLSRVAGKAWARGLFKKYGNTDEAIVNRKEEIRAAVQRSDIEPPDDYETLTLAEAAEVLGRSRFGSRNPTSWRGGLTWNEILDRVVPLEFEVLSPESEDHQSFDEWNHNRRAEHDVAYAEMSARLHASPRITALHWPDFQVGGYPEEVGNVAAIASAHFLRIHHIVGRYVPIPFSEEEWLSHLERAESHT